MADNGNMALWGSLADIPQAFQKTIRGGRLSGFTDINPQGRWLMLTEAFGVCGFGWRYEIAKTWSEPGASGEQLCFVQADLYIRSGEGVAESWSGAITAIGGSKLIAKESAGLHSSDEGYKMALTDALGKAASMIGLGANIYLGESGSKYASAPERPAKAKAKRKAKAPATVPLKPSDDFPEGWTPDEEDFAPEKAQDGFPDWGDDGDPGPTPPDEAAPAADPSVPGTDWKGAVPSDVNDPTCPECHGQMWDGREPERGGLGKYPKRKSTAPDFKCRNKECEGLYWPAKA